MYKDTHTNIS